MPVNGPPNFVAAEIKETPAEIIAFRQELMQPWNKDIAEAAMAGNSFEECIGIIAFKLGVMLDGNYHIPKLCEKLLEELRKRRIVYH